MACKTWEPMIALDAGGDLPAADATELARHLRTCTTCQRFAEEMRESQQAVALLADASVDEAALAAVRAGVLREVERSGGRFFHPTPRVLALAAALVVALGALLLLRASEPHSLPRPRVTAAPTALQPPVRSTAIEAATLAAEAPVEDEVVAREAVEAAIPRPRAPELAPAIQTAVPASTAPVIAATTKEGTATEDPAVETPAIEMSITESPATEPMVIKLVSENDDLVIYWLVLRPDAATKETKDEISAV